MDQDQGFLQFLRHDAYIQFAPRRRRLAVDFAINAIEVAQLVRVHVQPDGKAARPGRNHDIDKPIAQKIPRATGSRVGHGRAHFPGLFDNTQFCGHIYSSGFCPLARTVSTGHSAWRTTYSAVLPKTTCFKPVCPWVGRTMRSASSSLAASIISLAGRPRRTKVCEETSGGNAWLTKCWSCFSAQETRSGSKSPGGFIP